jgi:hypothetical protein
MRTILFLCWYAWLTLSRAHIMSPTVGPWSDTVTRRSHMSHVARHTSHVTCHTSHVTRHTSHVTRHTSHVTRHMSHVTRHTSHVIRHTSYVTRHSHLQSRNSSDKVFDLHKHASLHFMDTITRGLLFNTATPMQPFRHYQPAVFALHLHPLGRHSTQHTFTNCHKKSLREERHVRDTLARG